MGFDMRTVGKQLSIYIALITIATTLSIIRTGFAFGIGNNVFHIPLVLNWESLSAFEGDAFYLSLNKFVSIVYPLIKIFSNASNIETVFLVAHFLSRGLAIAAISALLIFQLRLHPAQVALSLIAVALTPWLVGGSILGNHGLWISYFSHSEVTWGFLLLALMAAHAQRWTWVGLLAGLVFDINAFVGIWLLSMLGVAFVTSPPNFARNQLLKSTLVFLLCAAPVITWIAFGMGNGHGAFNYLEYIRMYYPDHFLIEASSWRARGIFAVFIMLGFTAASLMSSPRYWFSMLAGVIAVFLIGVILPYFFNHRIVFNLHLLRIGGVIQWLSTLMTIVCLVARLKLDGRQTVPMYAMIGLLSVVTPQPEPASLVAALISLAAIAWIESHPEDNWLSRILSQTSVAIALIMLLIAMEVLRYQFNWANALRWVMLLAVIWRAPMRWSYLGWVLLVAAVLTPIVHDRGQLIFSKNTRNR